MRGEGARAGHERDRPPCAPFNVRTAWRRAAGGFADHLPHMSRKGAWPRQEGSELPTRRTQLTGAAPARGVQEDRRPWGMAAVARSRVRVGGDDGAAVH